MHALNGVRTKHYLKVELEEMLDSHGFDVIELIGIQYRAIESEALSGSWDWLALAKRR